MMPLSYASAMSKASPKMSLTLPNEWFFGCRLEEQRGGLVLPEPKLVGVKEMVGVQKCDDPRGGEILQDFSD